MKKALVGLALSLALLGGSLAVGSTDVEAYSNAPWGVVPGYSTYTVNQFFYGSYPQTITVGNNNVLVLTSVRQLTPYYFYCTYTGYSYQVC